MNKAKKVVGLSMLFSLLFLSIVSFLVQASAATSGRITGSGVSFRSKPTTSASVYSYLNIGNIVTINSTKKESGQGCSAGWYSITYNGRSGYVCSEYVTLTNETVTYPYNLPWTSPKKAIFGGAEFIATGYIAAGQNTSYLKKYNVNPNSESGVNRHQYMANLAAPFSEAKTSFTSYQQNGLLSLPLHFTIPIFENMPDVTPHPIYGEEKGGITTVKDKEFEKALDAQKFPESYKKWLRALHEKYKNWTFESLQTGLDFHETVVAQQIVGSVQRSSCEKCVYKDSNYPNGINTEGNWYRATNETVAYYLDPRNFLEDNSVLMFEDLSYNAIYKEETVKSVLKGTFMEGKDNVDNLSYSSMFMEAGQTYNVNPIYLASLSRQEMGTTKGIASSGQAFEYKGIKYEGFYNFFNIGAYSSEENPAKAGVVYAAQGGVRNADGVYVGNVGGEPSVPVVKPDPGNSGNNQNQGNNNGGSNKPSDENTQKPSDTKPNTATPVSTHLQKMALNLKGSFITNVVVGTNVGSLKAKTTASDLTFKKANGTSLGDSEKITTGSKIKFKTGEEYTIVLYGDLTGDGEIDSADLLRMRQQLLGKVNLTGAYLEAAHVYTTSGKVDSADLLRLRQHLLGKNKINQA